MGNPSLSGGAHGLWEPYEYQEVSRGGTEYLEQVPTLQLCPGCAGSERPGSPPYSQTPMPAHMACLSFQVFWPPAQTFFFFFLLLQKRKEPR